MAGMRICFVFLCLTLNAQVFGQLVTPKHTFNVELGLPNTSSNKPFNSMMQGLVNTSLYYQYAFPSALAFGAGVRYSFFDVNEFNVPDSIRGGMHSMGAFIKVSHEKFHGERFGTDIGLKFGYTANLISTNLNRQNGVNPVYVGGAYIEPCVGLILSADEATSYRFHIGYAIQGFGFNPKQLGTNQTAGYQTSEFGKSTQYFIFGFGFTYYFGNKNSVE